MNNILQVKKNPLDDNKIRAFSKDRRFKKFIEFCLFVYLNGHNYDFIIAIVFRESEIEIYDVTIGFCDWLEKLIY